MERVRGLLRRQPVMSVAALCGVLSLLMFGLSWAAPRQGPRGHAAAARGALGRAMRAGTVRAATPSREAAPAQPTATVSSAPASQPQDPVSSDAGAPGHPGAAGPPGRPTQGPLNGGMGRDNALQPLAPSAAPIPNGPDATAPTADAAGQIQSALKKAAPGVGRANPFDPLVGGGEAGSPASESHAAGTANGAGVSVSGGGPRRAAVALPPIPPLDPSTPLPPVGGGGRVAPVPGPGPAAVPSPVVPNAGASAAPSGLRLAGLVMGPKVLAVIEESGHSYLVAAGEEIRPGLRVLTIDGTRQRVRLEWNGVPFDLGGSIPTTP